MGHLKTDADLSGIPPEDSLIRHDDKSRRVRLIVINMLFQYLQAKNPGCKFAADGRLSAVLFFRYLFGCPRRIVVRNDLPFSVPVLSASYCLVASRGAPDTLENTSCLIGN